MSALIGDVLSGSITPGVCNAAVNAGGKLLKVVQMSYQYGRTEPDGRRMLPLAELPLSGDHPPKIDERANRIAQLEDELKALRGQSA